jgi:hypothetical protein
MVAHHVPQIAYEFAHGIHLAMYSACWQHDTNPESHLPSEYTQTSNLSSKEMCSRVQGSSERIEDGVWTTCGVLIV